MIRHIWILVAKKLSGEATEEELRELEQLMSRQEADVPMDALEDVWKKTSAPAENIDADLENKWNNFESQLDIADQDTFNNHLGEKAEDDKTDTNAPQKPGFKSWFRFLSYAAVLVIIVGLVFVLRGSNNGGQGVTSVVAPQNGVSKITLPDGSNVWLNAGSKITYSNNADNHCREVKLSGEAYFDVVKDAAHPFTVATDKFKITVLGTAFNVRSYAKDNVSEATLVRGRIELALLDNPDRKYILHPEEKFTMNSAPALPSAKKDTAAAHDFASVELKKIHEYVVDGMPSETLWMKTDINFDNTDFGDIAEMMEHKYHVNINFRNDDLKKLKFTGVFKNESVEQAMKELQVAVGFRYKTDGDKIEIY